MLKRNLAIVILSLSLFTGFAGVSAQDATLPPEVPTAESVTDVPTEVPTLEATPTAIPTAEPTPDPIPVPDPGISNNDLFLVIVTVVGLVVTVLLSQKTAHDLAVQLGVSAPEWAWVGAKTTGIAGLDALQKEAKKTIEEDDDLEVDKLRRIAVGLINEIDAKRGATSQTVR